MYCRCSPGVKLTNAWAALFISSLALHLEYLVIHTVLPLTTINEHAITAPIHIPHPRLVYSMQSIWHWKQSESMWICHFLSAGVCGCCQLVVEAATVLCLFALAQVHCAPPVSHSYLLHLKWKTTWKWSAEVLLAVTQGEWKVMFFSAVSLPIWVWHCAKNKDLGALYGLSFTREG